MCVTFLVTHTAVAFLAHHPQWYAPSTGGAVGGDVSIYERWAVTLLEEDVAAYDGIDIEYPPAALPFLAIPKVLPDELSYRAGFIGLMLLMDAAGLVGMLLLARRWGSLAGAWLWTAFVPLLGPIVFLRFDLVPAVVTVWAVVAAAAGSAFGAGAWLGLGAAAKLWPGFLLPVAAVLLRPRRDLLWGTALLAFAAAVPFVTSFGDLFTSVIGYHSARGIQIESTWANIVLLATKAGHAAALDLGFGAVHVHSGWSPAFKTVATGLSVGAVVASGFLALRLRQRLVPDPQAARGLRAGDVPASADVDADTLRAQLFAAAAFTLLSVLLVTGSVLSPQFLIWTAALGAAACCAPITRMLAPAVLLLPAAVLTQAVFPFTYGGLFAADWLPLGFLTARNLLLAVIAVTAVRRLITLRPATLSAVNPPLDAGTHDHVSTATT